MSEHRELTEAGAHRLAAAIRAYWLERKYAPEITVQTMPTPWDSKQSTVFVVRSNLVNGLPPPSSRVGGAA